MELFLLVAGQPQIEQAIGRGGAWGSRRHFADIVDEEITDGHHLVPQFVDFPHAQLALGLLDSPLIEGLHLLLQMGNQGIRGKALVLVLAQRSERRAFFGFEQIERGGHGAISLRAPDSANVA